MMYGQGMETSVRPTNPADLLRDAIADRSGCGPDVAAREAEDLLAYLHDRGAHIAYDLTLPVEAPKGRRETSRAAAESISNLSDRQYAVHWLLAFRGPMTDEELVDALDALAGSSAVGPVIVPKQTPQSVRTRRHELVVAGHVVATGQKRPTRTGRQATVWAARESGRVAA